MDAQHVLIVASCLSAFCAMYCASRAAASFLDNQSRAHQVHRRAGAAVRFRVFQTGIPGISLLARTALGYRPIARFVQRVCDALDQRGISSSQEGVLSCVMMACVTSVLAGLLSGRMALGLVGAVGVVLLIGMLAARAIEMRKEAMASALPDALQAMSSCFGAGFTLVQTFSHLENELPGPLGQLFGSAAKEVQTGTPLPRALAHVRERGGIDELSFVAVALSVQHQTGGSMSRVLDATRESLKEEVDMKRSLRVHTAQAKLSAHVVTGVTIGLLAIMMLLSRDFLTPFFSSTAGMALLGLAIAMQIAGIAVIRSLLNVEVA